MNILNKLTYENLSMNLSELSNCGDLSVQVLVAGNELNHTVNILPHQDFNS